MLRPITFQAVLVMCVLGSGAYAQQSFPPTHDAGQVVRTTQAGARVQQGAAPQKQQTGKPVQVSQEKQKLISELMQLTHASDMASQVMAQMQSQIARQHPDIPPAFFKHLEADARKSDLSSLIAPIYARHYSADDLRGLVAFYKSPLGQKLIATMPQVLSESLAAGEKWGQGLAERAMRETEAEQPHPGQ